MISRIQTLALLVAASGTRKKLKRKKELAGTKADGSIPPIDTGRSQAVWQEAVTPPPRSSLQTAPFQIFLSNEITKYLRMVLIGSNPL